MSRNQKSKNALIGRSRFSNAVRFKLSCVRVSLFLLCLSSAACSSVPMITVPEAEYLGLQRQVRVLTREVADTKEDFEKERGEQLRSREYLRKVEHPLTLKEEQERSCKENAPKFEYYGSTFSEEQQRHFDLYTKEDK